MLNLEDNEYITHIGPETPMGALMREYWLPAMLSSELPAPDCNPVRVMMLGERLIGFRDSTGRPALLANLCPHRGASLFYGRNEEQGIRCVYHGWKFDTGGNCVEMPNEPAESNFKSRISTTAYPCVERAGIVWTYMGPRDTPPPMPGIEALDLAEGEWDAGAAMRDCNWLQAMEGDLDTSHVNFLHSGSTRPEELPEGTPQYFMALHRNPKFVAIDTDYGCMYGAYRPAGPGAYYWRIAQFLFPCGAHIPGDRSMMHRMWVPMDDHHTMFFSINRKPANADPSQQGFKRTNDGLLTPMQPGNTTGWYGRFRLVAEEENDYLLDRDEQRANQSYTGIPGTFSQDQAMTESMGAVTNRTNEHLGTGDLMVIRVRQRLLAAARALVDGGVTPPGVDDPEVFRTRPASVILPQSADWLAATEELRAPELTTAG